MGAADGHNGGVPPRMAVINVVGLTGSLIGPDTPHIARFREHGSLARIVPAFPAVTCTAQANYLTGRLPASHGIVGNGWYDRALAEVHFWKQSNHLMAGPKIWDELRQHDPGFTCAQLFWWFNMYSTANYSITPRPAYPADGRKVFDIYSQPPTIRPEIKRDLGEFPFAAFWGPAAGVEGPHGGADAASRWIAEADKWIERKYSPTLHLIYLPHLDYNLQRHGPAWPLVASDLKRIDAIAGGLISFFQERGARVVLLSEYGICAVDKPVHLNRVFRQEAGWPSGRSWVWNCWTRAPAGSLPWRTTRSRTFISMTARWKRARATSSAARPASRPFSARRKKANWAWTIPARAT